MTGSGQDGQAGKHEPDAPEHYHVWWHVSRPWPQKPRVLTYTYRSKLAAYLAYWRMPVGYTEMREVRHCVDVTCPIHPHAP